MKENTVIGEKKIFKSTGNKELDKKLDEVYQKIMKSNLSAKEQWEKFEKLRKEILEITQK